MLLQRLWRFRRGIMLTSVTALAAVLRFMSLGYPQALVFDEKHYARAAYSLVQQGYEGLWAKGDDTFAAGDFSELEVRADFVVHPPLGKWMIAAGIKAFGPNPFGWRFTAALFGTITVVIVTLIGFHLLRSVLWGGLAGLFLAIDGQHVVASRNALLDIFLTFFVVAAFGFFLLDRRRHRRALERRAAAWRAKLGLTDDAPLTGLGPRAGVRWWRFAAIVTLGLATGVKWSGLYFAVAFLLLSLIWDAADRRAVGVRSWVAATVVRSVVPAFLATLILLPATYVASWTSWFISDSSYMRQWALSHESETITWLPDAANSFIHFHSEMWDFHTHLTRSSGVTHGYAADPWGFIVQLQPTAYYWDKVDVDGQATCGANECVSAITALGNPALWWAGTAAFGFAMYRAFRKMGLIALGVGLAPAFVLAYLAPAWVPLAFIVFGLPCLAFAAIRLMKSGDLVAAAVASGVVAGWLPWLLLPDRVMFTFYSVVFAPWMMLTLAWALQRIAKPERLAGAWSRKGGIVAGGVVAVSLVLAGFFLPLYTGQWISYHYWHAHMWLGSLWV